MTATFRVCAPVARFVRLPVAGLSVLPIVGRGPKCPYCLVVDVDNGWEFQVFGSERAIAAHIHALKVLGRLGREYVD